MDSRFYYTWIVALSLVFVSGCSDFSLHKVEDLSPEIEVTPTIVNFGNLNAAGDLGLETVVVKNIGTRNLIIDNIKISDQPSVFAVTSTATDVLEPQEETYFEVFYDPTTYSIDMSVATVSSNDPDLPEVEVFLIGEGSAPVIQVTPQNHDFGDVTIGCEIDLEVVISNIGDVDLQVDNLDYFVSFPTNFSLNENFIYNGNFPWNIPPGGSNPFYIKYLPDDMSHDTGWVDVHSSDPVIPVITADQTGNGETNQVAYDQFEQQDLSNADVLFVVDNSCSMGQEQASLANNFNSFISVFMLSGVDYHIGVITTDNQSLRGDVITSTHPDPQGEFSNQVQVGVLGNANETGLAFAKSATSPGGEASPGSAFFRPTAKMSIIFVSDEKDHSIGLPSTYSSHFSSLKSSPNLISAHAVSGDYPNGCQGAEFGDGYYDVVQNLHGSFVSICSNDWGSQMEHLARESMLTDTFYLSEQAVPGSIEVWVDGSYSLNWIYDTMANSVIFDSFSIPSQGQMIDIEYAVFGDCL